MSKQQMVSGFNHNVKHRGQTFHVQTEDSGVDNPHIITHLFVGGNILASKKTSYADIAHADNLLEVVRAMMEEQHKEMLRNLINGTYDDVIEQYAAKAWQPGILSTGKAPDLMTPTRDGGASNTKPAAPPAAASPTLPAQPPPAPPAAAKPLPPEVVAAQSLEVKPKPKDGGDTIFGEDLISERSLDEVILAYLAEDTGDS